MTVFNKPSDFIPFKNQTLCFTILSRIQERMLFSPDLQASPFLFLTGFP